MKNLILPFVMIALFAIGSCGDDASVTPSVKNPTDSSSSTLTDKKKTSNEPLILQIDKVTVSIDSLGFMAERTYSNTWTGTTKDTATTGLKSLYDIPTFTEAYLADTKDTIYLIGLFKNSYSSSDPYGRYSSNYSGTADTLSIVLDTVHHTTVKMMLAHTETSGYGSGDPRGNFTRQSSVKFFHFSINNPESSTYQHADNHIIISIAPEEKEIQNYSYFQSKKDENSTNNGKTIITSEDKVSSMSLTPSLPIIKIDLYYFYK
ncbi:MAG: hypothetical protein V4642_01760 [Bacteroidota bacterium]